MHVLVIVKLNKQLFFFNLNLFKNLNIKVWCLFNAELYTSELYFDVNQFFCKIVAHPIEINVM